jgi:hypothetical protein
MVISPSIDDLVIPGFDLDEDDYDLLLVNDSDPHELIVGGRRAPVEPEQIEVDNDHGNVPDSNEIDVEANNNLFRLEDIVAVEEKKEEIPVAYHLGNNLFIGLALKFSMSVFKVLSSLAPDIMNFFLHIHIFISMLILIWFGTHNATFSSGNVICEIFALVFSLFSLPFPSSILKIIKLTNHDERINNVKFKVMCTNAKCKTVYDLADCALPDPENVGEIITRICMTVLFPGSVHKQCCSTPLMESVRGSNGKFYLRVKSSQKFILPGIGNRIQHNN